MTFKVGDMVRIVELEDEYGDDYSWAIGMTGVIESEQLGFWLVGTKDGVAWCLPEEIELMEDGKK